MAPPNQIRFVPAVSNHPRNTPGREMACVDPLIAPSAQYHYGANPNNNNQTDNPLSERVMDPFASLQVPPTINYPSPIYLVTLSVVARLSESTIYGFVL